MINCLSRNKNNEQLLKELAKLKKDWFSIYSWNSLARKGYSEEIAKLLLEEFGNMKPYHIGLRKNNFHIKDTNHKKGHHGQCKLSTDISQHTEKRFCRALFNLKTIPLLGKILDYEVPLQKNRKSKHGRIDLISYKDNRLFVIEAKQIGSSESILKAILETYVYSKLVIKVKKEFYADFKIEPLTKIVPSVLTFKSSTSGQQLTNLIKYPYITQFIEQLNEDLVSTGNEKIRFFLMMNTENEIKDCLETKQFNGEIKIVFKRKFNLKIEEIKL